MAATASGCRRRFGRFLWDRVKPARMPRMAFAKPCRCQRAALQCTVLANGLGRILGTARIKTAILSQQWADTQLISAQQNQKQGFHCCGSGKHCDRNKRISSARTSAFNPTDVAGPLLLFTGFDKRTIQSMAGNAVCRNNSRATRLMVLRVTARGANRLATTTPRRACGNALERT